MSVAKGRVVHTAKLSLSLLYLCVCVCMRGGVSGEGGACARACIHHSIGFRFAASQVVNHVVFMPTEHAQTQGHSLGPSLTQSSPNQSRADRQTGGRTDKWMKSLFPCLGGETLAPLDLYYAYMFDFFFFSMWNFSKAYLKKWNWRHLPGALLEDTREWNSWTSSCCCRLFFNGSSCLVIITERPILSRASETFL